MCSNIDESLQKKTRNGGDHLCLKHQNRTIRNKDTEKEIETENGEK